MEYRALCPAHEDKQPSLSVTERDGKILVNCHTGNCSTAQIVAAMNLTLKDLFAAPLAPVAPAPRRTIAATYPYTNEHGTLLYEAVRFSPKGFAQRRPNGDGWTWKLDGVQRVLYRLPQLLAAPDAPVFIVEGEKDADNLTRLGCVATSNVGGAGKWRDEYNSYMRGRDIIILPDNDGPGRKHAAQVAQSLHGVAATVKVVALPGLPEKGDVSDWLRDGVTVDDLRDLADAAPLYAPDTAKPNAAPSTADAPDDARNSKNESSHFVLLQGLLTGVEFWHTSEREAWATLPTGGHWENLQVTHTDFRLWLCHQFYKAYHAMPQTDTLQKVLDLCHARALFDGPQHVLHTRMAEHEGALWVDLGDAAWRSIKLTPAGWTTETRSPVKFRRPRGLLALPEPAPTGALEHLRPYINVTTEDFPLVAAWLVAALRPNRPFPVLMLHGEQGSAKSTTCKVLRRLLDPNKSPLRARPKTEEDLLLAATNGWVVTLENISNLDANFSDALCRLSTGGGFSKRKLHTDTDETLIDAMRPVLVNGINEVVTAPDLLDRALMIHLPQLSHKIDEKTFWTEFESDWANIFGGLLTAGCQALRHLDAVTDQARNIGLDLPRLADFTLWGIAAETRTGRDITQSHFLQRYQANRTGLHELALEIDQLADVLLRFMHNATEWKGKTAELWNEVKKWAPTDFVNSRDFPRNPIAMGKRLMRLAPNLRNIGLEYVPIDRTQKSDQRGLILRWNK